MIAEQSFQKIGFAFSLPKTIKQINIYIYTQKQLLKAISSHYGTVTSYKNFETYHTLNKLKISQSEPIFRPFFPQKHHKKFYENNFSRFSAFMLLYFHANHQINSMHWFITKLIFGPSLIKNPCSRSSPKISEMFHVLIFQ